MLAIIGFILAFIGAVITLIISFMGSYILLRCIIGPIALILSVFGFIKAKKEHKWKGFAIAGIIISGIQTLYVIYIIVALLLFMN